MTDFETIIELSHILTSRIDADSLSCVLVFPSTGLAHFVEDPERAEFEEELKKLLASGAVALGFLAVRFREGRFHRQAFPLPEVKVDPEAAAVQESICDEAMDKISDQASAWSRRSDEN